MKEEYFPTFCGFKLGQISGNIKGFYSLVLNPTTHQEGLRLVSYYTTLTELEDVKN